MKLAGRTMAILLLSAIALSASPGIETGQAQNQTGDHAPQ